MVRHVPVLLDECMDLDPADGGSFADLTFSGGHSREILKANSENTLVAFDCDPDAGRRAKEVDADFGDRFTFHDLGFQEMDKVSSRASSMES